MRGLPVYCVFGALNRTTGDASSLRHTFRNYSNKSHKRNVLGNVVFTDEWKICFEICFSTI